MQLIFETIAKWPRANWRRVMLGQGVTASRSASWYRYFGIAEEQCNAKESRRCNQMICATEARQSVNSSGRSWICASP